MTDFNDESSEAGGIQPDPVGDAHGVDGGQAEPFPPASEGADVYVVRSSQALRPFF